MIKKYDYHSIGHVKVFLYAALIILTVMGMVVAYIEVSRTRSVSATLFITMMIAIAWIIAYFEFKRASTTSIEISDDGILFRDWRKNIRSTWAGIQAIKKLTPIKGHFRYKIVTANGNFTISEVEPANRPVRGFVESIRKRNERAEHLEEIIAEIRRRAPQVEERYSILIRPL